MSLLGALRHLIAKIKDKLSHVDLDSFVKRARADRAGCYSSEFEKKYQLFLKKSSNPLHVSLNKFRRSLC